MRLDSKRVLGCRSAGGRGADGPGGKHRARYGRTGGFASRKVRLQYPVRGVACCRKGTGAPSRSGSRAGRGKRSRCTRQGAVPRIVITGRHRRCAAVRPHCQARYPVSGTRTAVEAPAGVPQSGVPSGGLNSGFRCGTRVSVAAATRTGLKDRPRFVRRWWRPPETPPPPRIRPGGA